MDNGLIKLTGNLQSPGNTKASDFPAVGPSGAAGMSEGDGKLVMLTENQMGPGRTQDSGDNTPSVWGKDGEFKVTQSKSESTAVKCGWSVDLDSGQISPSLTSKY